MLKAKLQDIHARLLNVSSLVVTVKGEHSSPALESLGEELTWSIVAVLDLQAEIEGEGARGSRPMSKSAHDIIAAHVAAEDAAGVASPMDLYSILKWKASHRITFIYRPSGPFCRLKRYIWEVMLVEDEAGKGGPAFQETEWERCEGPDWFKHSDGEWAFNGDDAPFGADGDLQIETLNA